MAAPGVTSSRILFALAALAGIALTLALGEWQLRRAAGKIEMQQRLEQALRQPPVSVPAEPIAPGTLDYDHVEARGEFRPELTILLDNRVHDGVVGYHVVTPLRLTPGEVHVLVKRGWVKAGPTREQLPAVHTPEGPVRLEGTALPPSRRHFELSSQTVSGNVWQNLDLARYAQRYGVTLQPLVLEQRNDTGDALVRDWPRPDTGVNTHRAYALQWFALSAAIAITWIVLDVRRRKAPQRAA
jgi:surfeit locus 1 family protein